MRTQVCRTAAGRSDSATAQGQAASATVSFSLDFPNANPSHYESQRQPRMATAPISRTDNSTKIRHRPIPRRFHSRCRRKCARRFSISRPAGPLLQRQSGFWQQENCQHRRQGAHLQIRRPEFASDIQLLASCAGTGTSPRFSKIFLRRSNSAAASATSANTRSLRSMTT